MKLPIPLKVSKPIENEIIIKPEENTSNMLKTSKETTLKHNFLQRGDMHMQIKLTAVFQKVPEGYIGFVEELPGANTQGDTLEKTRSNLEEAVQLILETNRELAEESLQGQDVIKESFSITTP